MKFKKTILENGLRIITVPMDTPTVTVLVLVEAGSKYETKGINGLSHFLEHMCFKGTKKRPTALKISSELDGIGSQNNAFTSQEYTGYYAKAAKKHFEKILDIVSDIYINPIFDAKEVEKEKGVIIDEINMYEDMPNRHVHDLFGGLLYGDQPAGWNVAGTKEIIRSLNREDFIAYRKKHYVAKGTIVVVAGNIDEDKAVKLIEEKFKDISTDEKHSKLKVVELQTKPQILLKHKETDQTHLVIGFRSFDIFSKWKPVLTVLATILGGGMSSRLFEKLRNEMGVGYYVSAGSDLSTDHGSFAVWTGVANARIEEVIKAIIEEFERLTKEKVSEEELAKVREYLIGNMYLGLESSDSIANFYGGQEVITGKMKKPEEFAKEISSVTAEEIITLAKQIFVNNGLNMAMIGPFKDSVKFEKIFRLE